jgi:23S rRNA G2445 N2-methylase RlmL
MDMILMQAKKNAKIAGVQKYITFSRQNLEWIDLKQEEKKVDKIVSYPPQESRNTPQKEITKIYHELFYQAEYILNDTGLVVMLSKSLDLLKENAEKFKFFLKETKELRMGEQKMLVGIFAKEKIG